MSGSIGGNRISRANVKPTVDSYIKNVLNDFPGYKDCQISGSYNAGTRADHGDIDLVVWIEGSDLKKLKLEFKKHIENLSDEICPPFRSGKNKGKKAQMYGSIVTCQVPIVGKEEDYVQVDNIIVTTKDEAHFQKSFLDLDAQKQTLFTALVRVLDNKSKEEAFKHFGINNLPILAEDGSEEFEFVLSTAGLSLRKIKLSEERKQIGKVELWRSVIWDDVKWLLSGWDFNKSYNELLQITADKIKDERSRKRICGVMKSMINIGPGEVGTPKGDAKEKSIKDAYKVLKVKEEFMHLKDFILESRSYKQHESILDSIERSRHFNTYKDYLDWYCVKESTIEHERDFFNRESLHNYDSLYYLNRDLDWRVFERLGYSLSPNYVEDRLWDELGSYIREIERNTEDRKNNITLKIILNNEVLSNRQYKREFRDELNEILHFCNWFIFYDPFEKPKPGEKRIQTNYYKIEPAKPENASRFIYDDCKGIIYRLLYYKGRGNTEKKLKNILKNGLIPKEYKHEFENNLSVNKIYFIVNTSKEKIEEDLDILINSDPNYNTNRSELKFIKIDLNKFKSNHNKSIECFQDPRMNLKCYWTAEFIPPSCIEDVTEEFKDIILWKE